MAAKLGPGDPAHARRELTHLVAEVSTAVGPAVAGGAQAAIVRWLERLLEWNARIDLTAARSLAELVDLMVTDALVVSRHVDGGARGVDVGTGAGAPGLALALLRPDVRMTLVEPLGKRASFLRTALGHARRGDVTLERARGEALEGRRAWEFATSRATLAPGEWLALAVTLVPQGGGVWVLLAKDEAPRHAHARVELDLAYRWPLTGAARRAVLYRVDR